MNKTPIRIFTAKYNYNYWTKGKTYRMIRSGFLENEVGQNMQISSSLLREYFEENN